MGCTRVAIVLPWVEQLLQVVANGCTRSEIGWTGLNIVIHHPLSLQGMPQFPRYYKAKYSDFMNFVTLLQPMDPHELINVRDRYHLVQPVMKQATKSDLSSAVNKANNRFGSSHVFYLENTMDTTGNSFVKFYTDPVIAIIAITGSLVFEPGKPLMKTFTKSQFSTFYKQYATLLIESGLSASDEQRIRDSVSEYIEQELTNDTQGTQGTLESELDSTLSKSRSQRFEPRLQRDDTEAEYYKARYYQLQKDFASLESKLDQVFKELKYWQHKCDTE